MLTGENVTVAVIDTGVDMGHDEFKHLRLAGWKEFVYGKEQPYDNHGHGSHVAGIIVADDALRGGAIEVDLLVAQVFPDEGKADNSDIAEAVDWATDQGADIITMSLGGESLPGVADDIENAVNEAMDKGVFVVASAGNGQQESDDEDGVKSPASVARVRVGEWESSWASPVSPSSAFASPKSRSLTSPSSVNFTLAGFKSR